MERIVSLLFLISLSSCQACVETDQLVKLECIPGEKLVCDEHGENFPSADSVDIAQRAGQCSYGLRKFAMG